MAESHPGLRVAWLLLLALASSSLADEYDGASPGLPLVAGKGGARGRRLTLEASNGTETEHQGPRRGTAHRTRRVAAAAAPASATQGSRPWIENPATCCAGRGKDVRLHACQDYFYKLEDPLESCHESLAARVAASNATGACPQPCPGLLKVSAAPSSMMQLLSRRRLAV